MLGLLRPQSYEHDGRPGAALCPPACDEERGRSHSLDPYASPTRSDHDILQAIYNRAVARGDDHTDDDSDDTDDNDDADAVGSMRTWTRCTSSSTTRVSHRVVRIEGGGGGGGGEEEEEGGQRRDRGYSLPAANDNDRLRPPSPGGGGPRCDRLSYRRRSFSTTPQGIHNDGDELRAASGSSGSTDSPGDARASGGSGRPRSQGSAAGMMAGRTPVYRVLLQGASGVGKTALIQQFMTSEYVGAENTSFGKRPRSPVTGSPVTGHTCQIPTRCVEYQSNLIIV